MYLNNFRKSHANGLESCKKCDIVDKKAALKKSSGVDKASAMEHSAKLTLESVKGTRGATQSTVKVS